MTPNLYLIIAAAFSTIAAFLHYACIIWGAPLFRFLGAGEQIARMAERGHWYASFAAFVIGSLLMLCAAYALSAAGLILQLPFVRFVLSAFTAILFLRGFAFPLLKPFFPGNSALFWYVTSAICLVMASVHLLGLRQAWEGL